MTGYLRFLATIEAIGYCIDHQIYDMNQVELLLQEQSLSLLKP